MILEKANYSVQMYILTDAVQSPLLLGFINWTLLCSIYPHLRTLVDTGDRVRRGKCAPQVFALHHQKFDRNLRKSEPNRNIIVFLDQPFFFRTSSSSNRMDGPIQNVISQGSERDRDVLVVRRGSAKRNTIRNGQKNSSNHHKITYNFQFPNGPQSSSEWLTSLSPVPGLTELLFSSCVQSRLKLYA